MPIAETVFATLLKSLGDWVNNTLKSDKKLTIDYSAARASLFDHMATVERWASSISMLNLRKDKKLIDAFVNLNLDVGFLRYGGQPAEADPVADSKEPQREIVVITDLNRIDGHVAILGRPGAGKTTSLQKIADLALNEHETGVGGVPILVMLRDLRDGEGLVSHLLAKLGIRLLVDNSESSARHSWEERVLHRYLSLVSAILLVDGLDELNPKSRLLVETELRNIALAEGKHRLFLTCRIAEYNVDLKHVQAYTILPLSVAQIWSFAQQWLGTERAHDFVLAIQQNPYAGTETVPLTLAHLCAIYERDGSLPPRPVDVYEAVISLLVEQWDRERGISRVSRYADFAPRKKERFLQAVAYELTVAGRKGSFRHDDLQKVYGRIADGFGLPSDDEESVILEIESHTGLVLQSGFRRYQFVHLVIQEFLTAMHVQRTPTGINHLVPGFPNEMALVTAYSTSSHEYFEEVLKSLLTMGVGERVQQSFLQSYTARLQIENVFLPLTARNGWLILTCLYLIVARKAKDFNRMSTEGLSFFATKNTQEAVRLATAQAQVSAYFEGVRVIPQSSADIPRYLLPTLRVNHLFIRYIDVERSTFDGTERLLNPLLAAVKDE